MKTLKLAVLSLLTIVLPHLASAGDDGNAENAPLVDANAQAAQDITGAQAALAASKAKREAESPTGHSELKRLTLTGVAAMSVIAVKKGCTQTNKHWYGRTKKKVDCAAILLKGVEGVAQSNKDVRLNLGNIVLFPALCAEDASASIVYLETALGKRPAAAGQRIDISELAYGGLADKLSVLTSQPGDDIRMRFGGITMVVHTHQDLGNGWTSDNTRTINMGIGQN